MEAVAHGADPLAPGESSPLPVAPPAVPIAAVPPTAPARLREEDVSRDEEGLRRLSVAGAWRAVASLGQALLQSSHPVDVLLRLRWYRIVALLKVREHAQAEREIALLGDLRGQSWDYERCFAALVRTGPRSPKLEALPRPLLEACTIPLGRHRPMQAPRHKAVVHHTTPACTPTYRYPALFPGRRGSMVPFGLLLLHGLVPAMAGDPVQVPCDTRQTTLTGGDTHCGSSRCAYGQ